MSNYSERICFLREKQNVSQSELAGALGISRSTVGMYETGKREPNLETLNAIADFFDVDMDYLVGKSDLERHQAAVGTRTVPLGYEPVPKMKTVPLVGRIACGDPITAEENIEDQVAVPFCWNADFTLICEGDSMVPRIHSGDLVAIHQQPSVENGEIAAVRIDNEATLKHVYLYRDRLVLQPENQAYAPIVLIGEEMNTVQIEGKAVGLCRRL